MDPEAQNAIENKAALLSKIRNFDQNEDFVWDSIQVDVIYSLENGLDEEREHEADGVIPILLENHTQAYGLFVRTVSDNEEMEYRRYKVNEQMRKALEVLEEEYHHFVDVGAIYFTEDSRNYITETL